MDRRAQTCRPPAAGRRRPGRAVLVSLCLLAGCGGSGDPGVKQAVQMAEAVADPEMLTYHPDLHVEVTTMTRLPSGLLIQDLATGTGDSVTVGRIAQVRYTGWLHDGTEFDSNRDQAPFSFEVGAGDVITGWDQGIPGMRVGGKRRLVIPPALGYGETGSGPIPPYATLVFEVELIGVR